MVRTPGLCSHPNRRGPHRGPAKAHGVVEEEEEHGGSERVRELGEDRANEVAETASVVYDTAECSNVDRSIFCTGSTWSPQLGIQLGGLDPDPPCAPAPTKGLFGCGFRRAEDSGVPGPNGWETTTEMFITDI